MDMWVVSTFWLLWKEGCTAEHFSVLESPNGVLAGFLQCTRGWIYFWSPEKAASSWISMTCLGQDESQQLGENRSEPWRQVSGRKQGVLGSLGPGAASEMFIFWIPNAWNDFWISAPWRERKGGLWVKDSWKIFSSLSERRTRELWGWGGGWGGRGKGKDGDQISGWFQLYLLCSVTQSWVIWW